MKAQGGDKARDWALASAGRTRAAKEPELGQGEIAVVDDAVPIEIVVRVEGSVPRGQRDAFEIPSSVDRVDSSPGRVDPTIVVDVGVTAVTDAILIRIALIGIRDALTIVLIVQNTVVIAILSFGLRPVG